MERSDPPKARKGAKRYERPRGQGARRLGELVPDIGRAAFRKFGFVQSSIVTRWPEIVGASHARTCQPERIRFARGRKDGGTLELVVLPAHAPMIQHIVPEIIERVNRFFGYNAVGQVKLRQGAVKASPVKSASAPLSLKPVPVELGDSLRDIGDPELRAVLEGLARGLGSEQETDKK